MFYKRNLFVIVIGLIISKIKTIVIVGGVQIKLCRIGSWRGPGYWGWSPAQKIYFGKIILTGFIIIYLLDKTEKNVTGIVGECSWMQFSKEWFAF